MNNTGVYVGASSIDVINIGRESRYTNSDGAKRYLMVVMKTCQPDRTSCGRTPSHYLKTKMHPPISNPTEAPSPHILSL